MHEYGLCEGIVATVRHRAAGRRVGRVVVRIGVRHAALPAPMAQAVEEAAAGTEVSGARLDIVQVPLRIDCRACGASGDTSDPLAVCPGCGGDRVDLCGGDELTLIRIEYTGDRGAAG
jgi:hydrogenase nickel incorporation protein HypA/HybF